MHDIVVDFYWADPSTVISRTSATHIGRSYATLDPGSAEVLCIVPWTPSWVNDGHECLVVEISDTGAPAPSATPFDPPADPHVAQRNLTIHAAGRKKRFTLLFAGGSPDRKTWLVAKREPLSTVADVAKLSGLPTDLKEAGDVEFTLTPRDADPCDPPSGTHKIEIAGPGAWMLHVSGEIPDGQAALVSVEEHDRDRVLGGLAVLALHSVPTIPGY